MLTACIRSSARALGAHASRTTLSNARALDVSSHQNRVDRLSQSGRGVAGPREKQAPGVGGKGRVEGHGGGPPSRMPNADAGQVRRHRQHTDRAVRPARPVRITSAVPARSRGSRPGHRRGWLLQVPPRGGAAIRCRSVGRAIALTSSGVTSFRPDSHGQDRRPPGGAVAPRGEGPSCSDGECLVAPTISTIYPRISSATST